MEITILYIVATLSLISAGIQAYKAYIKKEPSLLGVVLSRLYLFFVSVANIQAGKCDIIALSIAISVALAADAIFTALYFVLKKNIRAFEYERAVHLLTSLTDKFTTLLENSPVGMYVIDEHGRIEYANPAFLDIFGYKKEELIGKNILTVVEPSYHIIVKKNIDLRVKNLVKTLDYTAKGLTKKGEPIDVRIIGSRSENGHITITGTVIRV